MKKEILKARKISENKVRKCMFENCSNKAIKSHVLQKNGILRQISENNHLVQLVPTNPFEIDEKGLMNFKIVGINDVYTFNGFCSIHDTEIFAPIENQTNLNFEENKQQALFCYRGLCQEIRRKEISLEWLRHMRPFVAFQNLKYIDSLIRGYSGGIKNLKFFKTEIESSMRSGDYDNFIFETVKIPKIEVCISVPLNIVDELNPLTNNRLEVFVTSFINVFPKDDESIVICGYHKNYPCKWTEGFLQRIKTKTQVEIFKEISDLITLRLEFWTMSQILFKNIPPIKLVEYKYQFTKNIYNHNLDLNTKLNLFENLTCT